MGQFGKFVYELQCMKDDKISVLGLQSIVLNFVLFMEENVFVIGQCMLKYISVYLDAKNITCPSLDLLLGSKIDVILSKTIKALMFIFLKVSVFYDAK